MSSKVFSRMTLLLILCVSGLCGRGAAGQTYSLPNVNSGCPANCRQISWVDGSDIWNGGTLPTYSGVACTGLHNNGSTDDGPVIQACINALSASQCAVLPADQNIYVNSTVHLKSNTCLRGAKAEGGPPFMPAADTAATQIILGSNALLTTQSFTSSGNGLNPSTSYSSFPTSYCYLSGSPQKGDTTLTLGSSNGSGCNVAVGTWIEVYGNDDPTLISATGTDGHCDWCGNNTGFYLQIQIVRVTAITSGSGGSGSTITISKPLYYPPYTASATVAGPGGGGTKTEPAGAKYTIITFPTQKAGFENLRIDGSKHDIGSNQILLLQGCLYCWVKNVETYMTGNSSGSAHMELDYTYGNEIRDSAFHDQRSGASGAGYGVYFQFVNSDAKVENNLVWHSRHWIVYQGGGSGTAILYNYADDGYTDDLTYFASGRTSHGGHPYFNLFEGNITSHIAADDFWGSSSHDVFFRNWIRGGEPNTVYSGGSGIGSFPPNSGFDAVDLYTGQPYYAYINNVLGNAGSSSGTCGTGTGSCGTWSKATMSMTCTRDNCGYEAPGSPGVYSYGVGNTLGGANVASSASTIIRQGNYDYKTQGVAYNDGGTGNAYQPSYYYQSKPAFVGSCPWPEQGSDLNPVATLSQPAYQRANGTQCSGGTAPPPPTGLTGVVKQTN